MNIKRVLVANRGEIALRVIRSCHALNIETVLAASIVDRDSLPARIAGRVVCIGPGEASKSYLSIPALIHTALATGCDALHPGYGFLSESEDLVKACDDAGICFIGPTAQQIFTMGNKLEARKLAVQCGLPVLPGSAKVTSSQDALENAKLVGLPVMFKAAAGGGGRGMKIVNDLQSLPDLFTAASNEARAAFGDDTLYIERYVRNARHVEVQVLGDGYGHVIHLGERDCSVQRRHQKLVEESPAPQLPESLRKRIHSAALDLVRSMNYRNAGTVEFLVDADAGEFYFLEMNTRIQVEHPVTEMVTGVDLVAQQILIASGEGLSMRQEDVRLSGHAIECRINAEDASRNFFPSPGLIQLWNPPKSAYVRLDSHCESGYRVPPHYDSLLGKLIVHGNTRQEALVHMAQALYEFEVVGIQTTLPFLQRIVADEHFASGRVNTRLLERLLTAA
jgi:acetyl-CoA carboxylase biotin carboxylase subunit